MILEGLPVDVKDKLALFHVEVDKGFDAADIVIEDDREDRGGITEGNATFFKLGLVESDLDGLTLGQVLGDKRVLLSVHEEVKGMRSEQTSHKIF